MGNMANRQMHPNSLKNLLPRPPEGVHGKRPRLKEGEETKTIAVRLPESLKVGIEEVAGEKGMKVSAYVRQLIENHLSENRPKR